MDSKNPIGGVQPPLLQSASSHCSRLSGILPESGEEEGPSRCSEGNGDESGDRSRKDSFSERLQSALFSAESRRTWRPIIDLSVLNTHIQCPSFKMESNGSLLKALQKGQWLTILDLKDAYFHIPIHPSYKGVVWQFRALHFGLNTAPRVFTAVTASVVAYAHLNGVSLHVYLDDWLLNPISEELAKQQTQWLLDLLHTPRLGGKCGEVKPDSFTGGHLLGNFARYQSRPRLPLRKEDRTMALHLGGIS